MDSVNEKEANTCAISLSNAALTGWKGFDPTGYRAYVHFKNSDQLGEELMTSYCREIAEEYQLPMPKNEQQSILPMLLNPLILH